MELTCEQLGITPDDIADRVATKIAERMLAEVVPDYDDETGEQVASERETRFSQLVRKRVESKVGAAVDAVTQKVIGNCIEQRLEEMKFPQTNNYGEHKGEPLTIMEFIERRANTYLTERVDWQGRSGYGANGTDRTRVTWMLENFLAERMKEGFENALKTANQQIVDGIAQTMKDKLAEVASKLKCEVKVK